MEIGEIETDAGPTEPGTPATPTPAAAPDTDTGTDTGKNADAEE